MSIKVTGLNALQRTLINLAPRAKRDIKEITEATGRNIEVDAKQRVAVDTGKLRQSIHYEPTNGGFGAAVSANQPYWAFVEFGTGGSVEVPQGFEDLAAGFKGKGKRTINLPARPFLIPAFLIHADKYYEAVSARLDKILSL